ncbi:MAG: phycobiliprotein lyase [Gloeomargaritaceae cyanobacterium C42_A2020_066]|nr:phycobiliprotein lyase [Gloeomargaritaceae cyanobacterium C42_A2020_066]
MNAEAFFHQSAGRWRSQRVTHHLAFRQAEAGESAIEVRTLELTDPDVLTVCSLHGVDVAQAAGASRVTWQGTMAWDKEGEKQTGSTVMVLVPEDAAGRQGKLLREMGYMEKTPVVGEFHMDAEDALVLVTEYDSLRTEERLWFPQPGVRVRASTVGYGFGGFTMATFAVEVRDGEPQPAPGPSDSPLLSVLGW